MTETLSILPEPPTSAGCKPHARSTARRIGPWLALAAIMVLATGLRLYRLGARSLWVDEAGSLVLVTGHMDQMLSLPIGRWMDDAPGVTRPPLAGPWWRVESGADMHPPLSYLLQRLFVLLLGPRDAVLRASSVLASVVSILLFYLICRELYGVGLGLAACLIMAMAMTQIYFAQDARPYTLALTLVLGACLALLRLEKRGGGRWPAAALAACAVVAMLTHYLTAGPLAALAAYALFRLRGQARRDALTALLLAGIAFAVLWGPVMLGQRAIGGQFYAWCRETMGGHLPMTLTRVAAVSFCHLELPFSNFRAGPLVGGIVCLLPFLLMWWRKDLCLWSFWLLGTLDMIVVADLAGGTVMANFPRYSLLATPALLAMVVGTACRSRVGRWIIPAAFIGVCLIHLPDTYNANFTALPTPPYRQIGQWIDAHSRPGDMLVLSHAPDGCHPPGLELRYFYGMVSHYINEGRSMPGPVLLLEGKSHDLPLRLRGQARIWIISGDDVATPQEVIPGVINADPQASLCLEAGQVWLVSAPL